MSLLTRLFNATAWKAFLQGSEDLSTPDVTKVQALALGQAVIVVLIVLGVHLDSDTQQLLLALSAAIGAGLPLSDAVIRHGRSANATDVAKAKVTVAQAQTGGDAATTTTSAPATPAADGLGLTEDDRAALLGRLMDLSARPRA